MSNGPLSLGQYFRQEREKRGLSLNDIESKTKISSQTLAYLEQDRLDIIPPKSFIRGFLVVIAKTFDMDEIELLRYAEKAYHVPKKDREKPEEKKSSHGIIIAIIIFVLLAAITAGIYYFSMKQPHREKATVKTSSTYEIYNLKS